jgi:glycosyltransferase involved in cell wall biosynthesis
MSSAAQELPEIAIVVPCYNEEARLRVTDFVQFGAAQPHVRFVLIDDGSTDGTRQRLEQIRAQLAQRAELLALPRNLGKAEAVRRGMLRAIELGSTFAGYWDADLATPLEEIARFVRVLREQPDCLVVFGARVQLLGRSIERSHARHYLGRVFATTASALLGLPIYDTQCGAKLFRVNDQMRALFAAPFAVGWTFDVELIARLIRLQREQGGPPVEKLIYELPLETWHDVRGSKVSALDFVRAIAEMMRIHHRYLRNGAAPIARE